MIRERYDTALQLHEDLANANTVRHLRAVFRAGALTLSGHNSTSCGDCDRARARVNDKAAELHARVEHDLSWHAPMDATVVDTLERLRAVAKNMAHEIIDATPPSREQSRALTSVEDALAQAIAALVRYQD